MTSAHGDELEHSIQRSVPATGSSPGYVPAS